MQKTAKQIAAELMEGVKQLGTIAEGNTDRAAVIVLVMADNEVHAGVAGSPVELSKLVARTANADAKIERVIKSGLQAAPFMAIFEEARQMEDDGKPCDCPACTADRAAKMANPNVN